MQSIPIGAQFFSKLDSKFGQINFFSIKIGLSHIDPSWLYAFLSSLTPIFNYISSSYLLLLLLLFVLYK